MKDPSSGACSCWPLALLTLFLTAPSLVAEEGPRLEGPNAKSYDLPTSEHPVGLYTEIPPQAQPPRITIRDFDIRIPEPILEKERFVLSTVGVEAQVGLETVFQPLLTIAVDKTFENEDPDGQWLAIWNLGDKRPGLFSHVRALIPGYPARKRSNPSELRKLGDHLERWSTAGKKPASPPRPTYSINQKSRRSVTKLALTGVKTGLHFVDVTRLGQFLFRGYLLRREDYQQRNFQQSYLGLVWYADQSAGSTHPVTLRPGHVNEIKFRLLSNRSSLGAFVRPSEGEDFVHGYENQMRDHLWGTSNRLAADANEYRLGFEEFHRFSATGVSLSLGGILYYDPAIAPAPELGKWSISNPFDLTFNPFRDPRVLEKAKSGVPVPLAIYTYQSNLALKPIITVDFFNPNNPRLREAATYWRRLGNEAISVSEIFDGGLGLLFNTLRRGLTFAANRKGLTLLSDNKLTMGVEELRLSLMSYLYFEPETADDLLERVDRLMVNPLVQSSRAHRLRARLHYRALTADGGTRTLEKLRQIRAKRIRKQSGSKETAIQFSDYRRYLRRQNRLKIIDTYVRDQYTSSIPIDQLKSSLLGMQSESGPFKQETLETIHSFRLKLEERAPVRPEGAAELLTLSKLADSTLLHMYTTSGRSAADLHQDVAAFQEKERKRAVQALSKRQKSQARFFEDQLGRHIHTLTTLVESGGDLTKATPFYVTQAVDFLRLAPQVSDKNPRIAKILKKNQLQIEQLLNQSHATLAKSSNPLQQPRWLQEERTRVLSTMERTRSVWLLDNRDKADAPALETLSGRFDE